MGLTAAALVAAVAATGCGGSNEASIYLSVPQQGADAPSSKQMIEAARYAVDEHNRNAKVKVKLVVLDDAEGARWSAEKVKANARRAADDDDAVAYIGERNSEATAVAMPILNRAGLAHVAPTSSAVALTGPDGIDPKAPERYRPTGKRTFGRVIPSDRFQAAAITQHLRSERVKRLFVVDDGALYGRDLATAVAAFAQQSGIKVADRRTISPDAPDYRQLAARVRRSGADAVVLGGGPASRAARVLSDIAAANPDIKLVGGDALAHDAFVDDLTPAAARRLRVTAPRVRPVSDKRHQALVRMFGADADRYVWLTYEATQAVLAAVERAGGDPDRAEVLEHLFAGSRDGVFGRWRFDKNGDSTLTVYELLAVRNGRLVPATTTPRS